MADATLAQIGSQTTLAYFSGGWTDLGPIRSIKGIGKERKEEDSTTLDSIEMEYIGGLSTGKKPNIVFTTANTNIDIIEGFVDAGDPVDFRITFPEPLNVSRYFSMVPLEYDHGDISPSKLLELTLSGRITGGISSTASH